MISKNITLSKILNVIFLYYKIKKGEFMIEKLLENAKKEKDSNNPYTDCYCLKNGDKFYIEPVFLLKLSGMKQFASERFDDIIDEMKRLVEKNHLIVFVGDDDEEITNVEGAIYLTIQDVCNPIKVYVEDKSRGSDYGD